MLFDLPNLCLFIIFYLFLLDEIVDSWYPCKKLNIILYIASEWSQYLFDLSIFA